MLPQGGEDLLGSDDFEGRPVPPEDVLDEERKRGDVVHVRVRDHDGSHAGLLVERQRVGEGARIHADGAVHEKRRLAVERRRAAVGSEDTNAHGRGLCSGSPSGAARVASA